MLQKDNGTELRLTVPTVDELDQNIRIYNQESWDRFQFLKKSKWLNEWRKVPTSDVNLEIDLLIMKFRIIKNIAHLSDQEKYDIYAREVVVKSVYKKAVSAYYKATNQRSSPNSLALIVLEHRKTDIIELFGKYYNLAEVHKICSEDFGLDVNSRALDNFRLKHIDKIQELQEEYSKNFSNVRLGYKRARLDELSWLYQETKDIYFARKKDLTERKFLKELLEQIRKEVDGDVITINGNIEMKIEATLNLHLQKEIYKRLPLAELVISRVAVRLGLNPIFLMWKLQSSYYSKFTGYGIEQAAPESKPDYPSAFIYNLDDIAKLSAENTTQELLVNKKFSSSFEISETKKEKGRNLRDILLSKVEENKKNLGSNDKYVPRDENFE